MFPRNLFRKLHHITSNPLTLVVFTNRNAMYNDIRMIIQPLTTFYIVITWLVSSNYICSTNDIFIFHKNITISYFYVLGNNLFIWITILPLWDSISTHTFLCLMNHTHYFFNVFHSTFANFHTAQPLPLTLNSRLPQQGQYHRRNNTLHHQSSRTLCIKFEHMRLHNHF